MNDRTEQDFEEAARKHESAALISLIARSDSWYEVKAAKEKLLGIVTADSVKQLAETIKTSNNSIAAYIVKVLGKIGTEEALQVIVNELKYEFVGEEIIEESGKQLCVNKCTLANGLLLERLKEKGYITKSRKRALVAALGELRSLEAIELMIDILKNDSEEVIVREQATTSLGNFRDARVILPLIEASKSDIKKISSAAFESLKKLGVIKDFTAGETHAGEGIDDEDDSNDNDEN